MKLKLTLFMVMLCSMICFAKTSFSNDNPSMYYGLDCENNQLNVVIELKDYGHEILFPNFRSLIIPEGDLESYVSINICVKDFRISSIDEEYDLYINYPNLQTTLDPVKIPPPPPSDRANVININSRAFINDQNRCNYSYSITLPHDAYGDDIPFDTYIYPGNYHIEFSLKLDNNEVAKPKSVPLKVYSFHRDSDYISNVKRINKNPSNGNIIVYCEIYDELDNLDYDGNYKMHLYQSIDNIWNSRDVFLSNKDSNPHTDGFYFELSRIQYDHYQRNGMHLITIADPLNEHPEICENNNWNAYQITTPYAQLEEIKPSIGILDARVFKNLPGKATLSCIVKNYRGFIGPSALKVGVYVKDDNLEDTLLHIWEAGNIAPFTQKTLSFQMNENLYGARYAGKELFFKIDPENEYQEGDFYEKDNTRKIINSTIEFDTTNLISAEHNNAEEQINFTIEVTVPKQMIYISIYHSDGKYIKTKAFEYEDHTSIGVYEKEMSTNGLGDGLYYYSALLGTQEKSDFDNWYDFLYQQTYNQYNGTFYKGEAAELEITDVRIQRVLNNNWVEIKASIVNNGNLSSPSTELEFYRENYPRQYINTRNVPSLDPGAQTEVTLYVSWNYYTTHLYQGKLILVVDPDNKVKEIYEDNNEKKIEVPNLFQEQNYIKVSPNPFSSYVNFDFPTNFRNTTAKLSIYNQQGNLVFYTEEFYPQPGAQQIRVLPSHFQHSGIYHYSILIGWNDHYYPFTGTIIKK